MAETLLQRIKRYDEAREGFPGEHWLAFAAGVGLWVLTRRHPSPLLRVASSVAATLLVARAATGRKVPRSLARLPFAGRPSGRHEWIS